MTGITKPPLEMIAPITNVGTVVSTGAGLAVEAPKSGDTTELQIDYDNVTGTLTVTVPGYAPAKVSGFATVRDIGEGTQGRPGVQGRAGSDGSLGADGDQGRTGCPGPVGARGAPGKRGPAGQKGEPGDMGPTGPQGEPGKDGVMLVRIQADDPGPVGAGAIWVRP